MAYYNRGAIYSELSRPAEAVADYKQGDPAESAVCRGLLQSAAWPKARLKKMAESIRDLRKAVELNGAMITSAKKVSGRFPTGHPVRWSVIPAYSDPSVLVTLRVPPSSRGT